MKDNIIILGLDIGGANTKAALILFDDKNIENTFSYIEYFPFWEKSITNLDNLFKNIIERFIIKSGFNLDDLSYIAITITAELSDAFQTKREGILTVLNALKKVFPIKKQYFISHSGKFITFDEVKNNPLNIAAANWVSTALYLGKFVPNCILIDSGSTTTDIIPIVDSKPVTKGDNDITRMINHELIYTGGLRATIPSITHFVPYRGNMVRISFEKFALVSDVHMIMGNITEKDYINDTADNRPKKLEYCYARLARIICMDIESISKEELNQIAEYIYNMQLNIIKTEITLFYNELINRYPLFKENPHFIVTGLSADFLIKKALNALGFSNISDYKQITNIPDNINSSALAVAGAFYYYPPNSI